MLDNLHQSAAAEVIAGLNQPANGVERVEVSGLP